MIRLQLHGALAECVHRKLGGEPDGAKDVSLDLGARTPADALRLVMPQAPGFEAALKAGRWLIAVNGEPVTADQLTMEVPDGAEVEVRPELAGEAGIGTATLVGWILTGAAVLYAVTQMPSIPDTDHLEQGQRRNLFSGPVNSAAQGGAVPLIYGTTRVGSTVLSGGITAERVTGGDHAEPDPISPGGRRDPGAERPRIPRPGRDSDLPSVPTGGGAAMTERSVMRVVDLLGEGEIEGLVDGLKSVFIDGVAVEDDNGKNIDGVSVELRKGLAHGATGQEPLAGFDVTETLIREHDRVKIVRDTAIEQSVEAGFDAVRVTLQWPRLAEVDDKGATISTDVTFKIASRKTGGNWKTVLTQTVRDTALDTLELSWRVERPAGVGNSGTWEIQLTRITPDSTDAGVSNDMYWQRSTGLRDAKLTYPHSAVAGLTIQSDRTDINPTRREYLVKGRKVMVPPTTAWNPKRKSRDSKTQKEYAATYAPMWNGQNMVRAWTDNPAWIVYDLLTDSRAGLGGIPGMKAAAEAARGEFFVLSKQCDELVPAAGGGKEPRWRFNGTIVRREQARKAIDWVLSGCRAGAMWSEGGLGLVIDGDSDLAGLVGNANVIDGEFEYQGLRWQERYSAVAVTWQDPKDGYRSGIELVVDDGLVEKYGYRQRDVAAVGCTSRGQAHRAGRMLLYEQENESETVKFRAALEGSHLRPGDRVRIADGQRSAGAARVASVEAIEVDGGPGTRPGVSLDRDRPEGLVAIWTLGGRIVVEAGAEPRDLLLPAGETVERGAVVALETATQKPSDWIVTKVSERDPLEVGIDARQYAPDKYSDIETSLRLRDDRPDAAGPIKAPEKVTIREETYEDGSLVRSQLEISVRGGDDPRIDEIEYQIRRPRRAPTDEEIRGGDPTVLPRGAWEPLRVTASRSIVERDVALGRYKVRARFRSDEAAPSAWKESADFLADGKTDVAQIRPTGLDGGCRIQGGYLAAVGPAPTAAYHTTTPRFGMLPVPATWKPRPYRSERKGTRSRCPPSGRWTVAARVRVTACRYVRCSQSMPISCRRADRVPLLVGRWSMHVAANKRGTVAAGLDIAPSGRETSGTPTVRDRSPRGQASDPLWQSRGTSMSISKTGHRLGRPSAGAGQVDLGRTRPALA